MREKIKLGKLILSIIIYGLIVIFAIAALMGKYSVGGIKLLSVQSGSMEPTIKTGSLVIVKSQKEYFVSDIITYQSREADKKSITHRIVRHEVEGVDRYITKGDANSAEDSVGVIKTQIIGKVIAGVPYLGYVVSFIRSVTGLILIIIIPALIIMYGEVKKIEVEAKRLSEERKKKLAAKKKKPKRYKKKDKVEIISKESGEK